MAHDKINLPPWNENMPTTQIHVNAEKMKFSIKDFFSKCDQMKNFIFCEVLFMAIFYFSTHVLPKQSPGDVL